MRLLFSLLILSLSALSAQANILVSNKPLALIVAAALPGEPIDVLVPDGMSPHDFSLRPSDIRKIRSAKQVIWAGPSSEPFLTKFAQDEWLNATEIARSLKIYNGDPHVWLSPKVASAVVNQLTEDATLSTQFEQATTQLVTTSRKTFVANKNGFFVFHDAYGYWFDAIGVIQTGAFTLSPEHKPGARRIQLMRNQLQNEEVQCVLTEPQFQPVIVERITEGLAINRGTIDPLASHKTLTATAYVEWLEEMTAVLHKCLTN